MTTTSVVVTGSDRLDCEAQATREIDEFFGHTNWTFTRSHIQSLFRALGSERPSLYKGEFFAREDDPSG
jgi:hypothetical protein